MTVELALEEGVTLPDDIDKNQLFRGGFIKLRSMDRANVSGDPEAGNGNVEHNIGFSVRPLRLRMGRNTVSMNLAQWVANNNINTKGVFDTTTLNRMNFYIDTVDKNYLADFGYTREEVLAENDVEFNSLEEMGTMHEELNLGDIISDAYIYAVENSEYYDGDPVDVAVVPSGTVRDTYTKGDITVEDVFNSFSLGIGKDGVAGYPLISAYLTGKELKLAAEVDASVSDFMTTARLYCSGLNFAYNPHRMILNKVTDCYLTRADGERIEIQNDKLYHVVTDLYTGQMLGSVT